MSDKIKEISVFVDESGTFDPDVEASRFYIVCMVFHDQAKSIADNVQKLNDALDYTCMGSDESYSGFSTSGWMLFEYLNQRTSITLSRMM